MLIGEPTVNGNMIKVHELAYHPVRVGAYPEGDSQVMAKLRNQVAGTVGYYNRDHQSGDDHDDAQRFPYHTPAYIFKQPENDMEILHFTVLERDNIL